MLLAAAASLKWLASLDLAVITTSDDGFAALAGLTGLRQLRLRGQLAVSLGTLLKVFAATTQLEVRRAMGDAVYVEMQPANVHVASMSHVLCVASC